jgi:hypothetical protein
MNELSNKTDIILQLEEQLKQICPSSDQSDLMLSVMSLLQQNQNFTTKEHVEHLIQSHLSNSDFS